MALSPDIKLFTNPVFAEESQVADEKYARELQRSKDNKDLLKAGAYGILSLGTVIVGTAAIIALADVAAAEMRDGKFQNVWMYGVGMYGVQKGGDRLMNKIYRLRPQS